MSKRDPGEPEITLEELVAYAEERIPSGTPRRAAVEAHLRENVTDETRVQAWRRQDHAIRHAWASVAEEPLPPRLQPANLARRPDGGFEFGWPVALAVSILVAAWSGWMLGQHGAGPAAGPTEVNPFTERVAARLAALPTTASGTVEGITTVSVDDAPAPDLSASGLHLVRQETDAQGLQVFEYSGPGGRPVHMFMTRDTVPEPDRVRTIEADGFNLAYWKQGTKQFAIGGAIDADDLRALAFTAMEEMSRVAVGPSMEPGAPELEFEPIPPATVPAPVTKPTAPVQPEAALTPEIPLADTTAVLGQEQF